MFLRPHSYSISKCDFATSIFPVSIPNNPIHVFYLSDAEFQGTSFDNKRFWVTEEKFYQELTFRNWPKISKCLWNFMKFWAKSSPELVFCIFNAILLFLPSSWVNWLPENQYFMVPGKKKLGGRIDVATSDPPFHLQIAIFGPKLQRQFFPWSYFEPETYGIVFWVSNTPS